MKKRAGILFSVGILVALLTTFICLTVTQDQVNRAEAPCGLSFTDQQTVNQCANLGSVDQGIYNAESFWITFIWAAIIMLSLLCLISLPNHPWLERWRQKRVVRTLLIVGAISIAVLLFYDIRIDSIVLAGLCAPLLILDIGVLLEL